MKKINKVENTPLTRGQGGHSLSGVVEMFIRQPFPSPEDLPNPGVDPCVSHIVQADSLPSEPQRKTVNHFLCILLESIFLT